MTKNIKTETSWKHDLTIDSFHDDEVKVKEYMAGYKEFDKSGNLICEINYDSEGGISEKYIFVYDEKGHLVEEIIYYDEEEIAERITYERDTDGLITKEFNHYLDGSYDTTTYHYKSEKIIKKETKDSDGDIDSIEKYSYQGDNLVLYEKLNDENELVERNTYKFDDKGNETESSKWNIEDDKERTVKIFYDEAGEKIKAQQFNEKKQLISIVSFGYDENKKINKVIEENQHGKSILSLTHDENGNVIVQEERNGNDEINHRVDRKFDVDNNLLESKVTINRHGQGINDDYTIAIKYEFYD